MFTSQSLRAVVRPGSVAIREFRLDDVVHQLEVRGTLSAETSPELGRRIHAALGEGVRWLIVDVAGTVEVSDDALQALVPAARELRVAARGADRRGRGRRTSRARFAAWEIALPARDGRERRIRP